MSGFFHRKKSEKKRAHLAFISQIPKRFRIVLATGISLLTVLSSTFFGVGETWYIFIPLIAVVVYTVTFLAIYEGVKGIEWYMLMIVPVCLAIALYLFYALFPVRWLTRIPFLAVFGLLMYATLLASNILNVGVEKSIQLYRAAFSITYLVQALIIFLLSIVIFSLRLPIIVTVLILALSVLLLGIQLMWAVHLEPQFDPFIFKMGVFLAGAIAQVVLLSVLMPVGTNIRALLITSTYFTLSGLLYHYRDERLFPNVIREYIFVIIVVGILLATSFDW